MMVGISYSCFTQFFPSPPTPVSCTCSAVADKALKCTFWVKKRQFLAPVLDEAAVETSTLRASGSVHGAVGWNAFRLMTDFSLLFSPDLFLESSFLHGHISCVLETKMMCKKLLKSNCYWKKCLSSYNLHCLYSDEKPSFPSQAQPLMPSAGASLVPKIFNGDIKTCRLSSRVEENKWVIVEKKLLEKLSRGHCSWLEMLLNFKAGSVFTYAPPANETGFVLWSPGRICFVTKLPLPVFPWVIAACMRGERETGKKMKLYSD